MEAIVIAGIGAGAVILGTLISALVSRWTLDQSLRSQRELAQDQRIWEKKVQIYERVMTLERAITNDVHALQGACRQNAPASTPFERLSALMKHADQLHDVGAVFVMYTAREVSPSFRKFITAFQDLVGITATIIRENPHLNLNPAGRQKDKAVIRQFDSLVRERRADVETLIDAFLAQAQELNLAIRTDVGGEGPTKK